MFKYSHVTPYICARCLRALSRGDGLNNSPRCLFSTTKKSPLKITSFYYDARKTENVSESQQEDGAMYRRLSELGERNMEDGGKSAKKAVEEAGFDEELKQKLLDRLANANFRSDNQQSFSQANLPTSAGKATRDLAAAAPWSGTESVEDASLRMLNDAYKPLRQPGRILSPARPPKKIDTGRPDMAPSAGSRLANARDKTSIYSYLKDDSLSEKERDQMRKELKERFTPGARSLPMTLQGLSSLANERIEDAIARGQFKNLPRGKIIERDYNMSSPFLDTTEYFMNKIIQKQDIVPPWIEKQQEVVSTANKFRNGIRVGWRRHAARLIASRGGSLESQIARAEEYAQAEAIVNPSKRKEDKLNSVDNLSQVSQISLSGQLKPPKDGASEGSIIITGTEEPSLDAESSEESINADLLPTENIPAAENAQSEDIRVHEGAVFPFRDPSWEQIERAYHKAAIENLNNLTRSYNLMAPNLAKKPYFFLDRELRACFADVAPQLADEIRERAMAPKLKVNVITHTPGGLLERMGGGTARVYDSRKPKYGFKEFWRDLFGKKQTA